MTETHAIDIAAAIMANCTALDAGTIDRDAWSVEQNRLWKIAADNFIASEVMRLVAPSLTRRVPPYEVRKALREQTLAVGR